MNRKQLIRADVITSVSGSKAGVLAGRSDTPDLVALVEWSTSFDKRDPLPTGFHIAFLQALDAAKREKYDLDRVLYAKWVIEQQAWQWLVIDVEDLDPATF
ncbi:hypothetical protein [Streptomyces klenkii]